MTGRSGQSFLLPTTNEVGILIYDDQMLAIGHAIVLTNGKGGSYNRRVVRDDLEKIPHEYKKSKNKALINNYTYGEFYFHTSTIFNLLIEDFGGWATDTITDVCLILRTELPEIMQKKENCYKNIKKLKSLFVNYKKRDREIAHAYIDLLYSKLKADANARTEALFYV